MTATAAGTVDTPIGPLQVETTELGVVHIRFGADRLVSKAARAADHGPSEAAAAAHLAQAEQELAEYFAGTRRQFTVPLDWSGVDGFRAAILRQVALVPYGEVVSYGEVAARAGRPGAARAVGTTMAGNRLPLVVPCHRVILSSGALGQYGDDPEMKVWLLVHEGYLDPDDD